MDVALRLAYRTPNLAPKLNSGKLGLKKEAAGKVRVFAMVECWTQWLLSPIHDYIFNLLRSFPGDGTFDQLRPVDRLIKLGFTKF